MNAISLLVADDEPIVRTFIRQFVKINSLPVTEIFEAANGQEAVQTAFSRRPDLILLDISMPGLNGLEAAQAILRANPGARIVMVTAYDDFEYARAALRAGVADYLLKPLEHTALINLIEDTARRKERKEETRAPSDGSALPEGNVHPLVTAVRAYIDDRIDTSLRLDDIAAAVFVSPSHLSRTFHKYAGVSISDFITGQRKARACQLLKSSSKSVTEIAEALGFSSPTYFTAWFKRMAGLSPLRFRKNARA